MGYLDAIRAVLKRLIPAPARYVIRQILSYPLKGLSSAQYWTRHNVTHHRTFFNAQESLDYFDWRNAQYPGHIDLMPVDRGTGKTVLDFGCGPGNDLVGFALRSAPARLIGADVSPSSIIEAKARLKLHNVTTVELIELDPTSGPLPFETGSIDLIHSAGVLHHLEDMRQALGEFRRILKQDGYAQVMVYNYNSIWMHLYAGYIYKKAAPWKARLPKREIFKVTTDGERCPIVNCFTPNEFRELATTAGFHAEFVGAAISTIEMTWLPRRFDAIKDLALESECRNFLSELTFNDRLVPLYRGHVAGINSYYRLTPAR